MKDETVLLSLGSNMGDSLEYLLNAIILLKGKKLYPTALSSIYQTKAVGYTPQPDFLNMVIKVETALDPLETLESCLDVEKQLDRVRTVRWGPRTIDIDILFYGLQNITTEGLQIPHPRLKERAFVLVPLGEIEPEIFKTLNVDIPSQKVDLIIPSDNVKIKLQMKGMTMS